MRLRLGTIAAVTGLLLAALAPPVAASVPAPERGTDPDLVRVTIKVVGCDACSLGLNQLREGDTSMWSAGPKKVNHGRVVFSVPAEHTHGTSIAISAPWADYFAHGVSYVAVRYGGLQPGDSVSPQRAARAERGSRCWAGTNRDMTFTVRVDGFEVEQFGEMTTALRAFTTRTLPSTDMGGAWRGTIVTTYPVCPGR